MAAKTYVGTLWKICHELNKHGITFCDSIEITGADVKYSYSLMKGSSKIERGIGIDKSEAGGNPKKLTERYFMDYARKLVYEDIEKLIKQVTMEYEVAFYKTSNT